MGSSFEQWPEQLTLAVLPYTRVCKRNIGTSKLLVQCDRVLLGINMDCPRRGGDTFGSVVTTLVQAQIYPLPFRMCGGLIV